VDRKPEKGNDHHEYDANGDPLHRAGAAHTPPQPMPLLVVGFVRVIVRHTIHLQAVSYRQKPNRRSAEPPLIDRPRAAVQLRSKVRRGRRYLQANREIMLMSTA
jgi:hypothetical protein